MPDMTCLESRSGAVFLERIPPRLYREMEDWLAGCCYFRNGEKMRLAEYFVGLRQKEAEELFHLGRQLLRQGAKKQCATQELPDGFFPPQANLSPVEQQGGATFFCLDAAVTAEGLRLIECQAVPTYPVTAARLNSLLQQGYLLKSSIFLGEQYAEYADFIKLMREILIGNSSDGNILVDRQVQQQKTNFEFYATQEEIDRNIKIVDAADLFADKEMLFYKRADKGTAQVRRLYNRVLVLEALFDDAYPHNALQWHFRYDQYYQGLRYCNHPARSLTLSKQQLVCVRRHPLNPECLELDKAAEQFADGTLAFADYVWKHKLGAAGRELILSPSCQVLTRLQACQVLDQYIAQRKVQFETFLADDRQEKIIELRLMFCQSLHEIIAVPMARIGHLHRTANRPPEARIHFADNNMPGYGFAPVLLHR